MKLIKQTTLLYQEGKSDKIYEVDLSQTDENLYVVNFRYGRRGTNLKEGVKTTQAVPQAQAQKIFDELVASKAKKGYQDVKVQTNNNPLGNSPQSSGELGGVNLQHQAILNRLANQNNNNWPLERAIWRAGELKISEATPLLIQLIGTGESLRDYCIAWALGFCGDETAIPVLRNFYEADAIPDFVRRIAFEALLKLSDENTAAALRTETINLLSPQLREIATNNSAEEFSNALQTYLNEEVDTTESIIRTNSLDILYQINNKTVRPALLDILRTAPFQPNYFKPIRHIFKIAEYRHDAEVFGIIAYRLEKEKAMFSSDLPSIYTPDGGYLRKNYGNYNYQTHRYEVISNQIAEELKNPSSRIAYSSNTRKYLIGRIWRTLKQLGEAGNSEYVKMAVSILLQYSDVDAEPARQTIFYRWVRSSWTSIKYHRDWDSYAGYLTLNHILYENSPRYVLMSNSKAWRCREDYKPGNPEPEVREEAFPQLWEQNPTALLQLLLESNCRIVHQFAVKALRVCQQFLDVLDLDTIIELVSKPYQVTAQLGFELARERYNPAEANRELILACVNCILPEARTQAYQWIEQQRQNFLEDSYFLFTLVTSLNEDTRAFARNLLNSSLLSETTARLLIGRIIVYLLALETTSPLSENSSILVKEIADTLLIYFAPQLRTLGIGVVLDLLHHPMPEIQELGANILLNHNTKASELPSELISSLLTSPHEAVHIIGVRIFGQLPDETLLQSYELLLAMTTHELADMCQSIRPVIRRLGREHSDFAAQLATELINVLLRKEKYEGVHNDILHLLREDLPDWMSGISRKTAILLLKAKSTVAQELGGLALTANSQNWTHEFETSEIVKLANHEILSVREAARTMFLQILDRIRSNSQEKLSAVRLLEAKWDDSREFALQTFTNSFTTEDWTPEVMISICDSIREDVRQFGRDLVTRNFQQTYGQEYLLKFSEHPSADMQLFATNYLENYAVDNPDRLRELTPYFISVLSRVNRGRIAKQRLFAFLDTEAQKSQEAAQLVAEILTRQSLTMAIGDKAKAIQTMLKIHQTYPHISLPIQVKPVSEVRN
ncbi:MAG: WGR domain-containing protein [Potamolinea sp.]